MSCLWQVSQELASCAGTIDSYLAEWMAYEDAPGYFRGLQGEGLPVVPQGQQDLEERTRGLNIGAIPSTGAGSLERISPEMMSLEGLPAGQQLPMRTLSYGSLPASEQMDPLRATPASMLLDSRQSYLDDPLLELPPGGTYPAATQEAPVSPQEAGAGMKKGRRRGSRETELMEEAETPTPEEGRPGTARYGLRARVSLPQYIRINA